MGGVGEGAVSGERGVGSGPPTTTPNGVVGSGLLPPPSPLSSRAPSLVVPRHCSLTIQNLGLIVVGSVPSAASRNRIASAPWDPPAVTTV